MAKELTDLFESVKKAAEEAERTPSEEDRCINNLKLLRDFPVNCDVLISTQVGKHLRQLTKHTNDKIKSSASEVVAIWKDIVITETVNNNKINGTENDDSNGVKKKPMVRTNSMKKTEAKPSPKNKKSNEIKLHGSPAPEEVPKPNASSAIKIEKVETLKTKRADNVQEETLHVEKKMKIENNASSELPKPPKLASLVYCNDPARDKVREMLAEALSKVSEEVKDDKDLQDLVDESDPCRVAVLVETAMFEKWGKSSGTNKAKYRSILFNIKDANNPDFRRKVLLGNFQPPAILELTADQMASKARQDQNEKIKQRALFNSELGGAPQASTDQFTCGKCKKKKTTYYQMQTRSADEPMTTFVTCVNCNNRWKFC